MCALKKKKEWRLRREGNTHDKINSDPVRWQKPAIPNDDATPVKERGWGIPHLKEVRNENGADTKGPRDCARSPRTRGGVLSSKQILQVLRTVLNGRVRRSGRGRVKVTVRGAGGKRGE